MQMQMKKAARRVAIFLVEYKMRWKDKFIQWITNALNKLVYWKYKCQQKPNIVQDLLIKFIQLYPTYKRMMKNEEKCEGEIKPPQSYKSQAYLK